MRLAYLRKQNCCAEHDATAHVGQIDGFCCKSVRAALSRAGFNVVWLESSNSLVARCRGVTFIIDSQGALTVIMDHPSAMSMADIEIIFSET